MQYVCQIHNGQHVAAILTDDGELLDRSEPQPSKFKAMGLRDTAKAQGLSHFADVDEEVRLGIHRPQTPRVREPEPNADDGEVVAAEPEAPPPVPAPVPAAEPDDLAVIKGIGPATVERLVDAGITTFVAVRDLSKDQQAELRVKPAWVREAKRLAK